ncbi:MAG: hypothetical protein CUN55_18890 [Phototrophicales bacterium]|nr:MAG: hypothetical protein CUN55_18890 [Phototrophicales bacterium]
MQMPKTPQNPEQFNGSNNGSHNIVHDTVGTILFALIAFALLIALLRIHRINRELLQKQIEQVKSQSEDS